MHYFSPLKQLKDMPQNLTDEPGSRVNTYLLCCGIAGAILFGIINFSLSAFVPDYIIGRQPIGDLELVRHGWIQSADFILFGLFTWVFAIGLRRELAGGFGSVLIPFTQELVAVGLILAGIFTRDPVHLIASILIFTGMVLSCFLFALRFNSDPHWRGWATYSVFSGLLMIVFLGLFAYARVNHGYSGLFERAVMLVRGLWLFLFAVRIAGGTRLTQPVKTGDY